MKGLIQLAWKESSTKSVPTAYNTQLMLSYYTRFIKIQLFRLPILLLIVSAPFYPYS